MKNILFVFLCLSLLASSLATSLRSSKPGNNKYKTQLKINKPNVDLCPGCIEFMVQFIDALLNVILNGGIIGSCEALCSYLPNQIEAMVCNLLCDYVGIEAFITLIEDADPDPIWICQELTVCPHTDGGKANITKMIISPTSGPEGGTFNFAIWYTVYSATSTGGPNIWIFAPDGGLLGEADFNEGLQPGNYNASWILTATPSEDESFQQGVYVTQFALCAGDCTTIHQWGGIYDTKNSSFTITN